MPGFKQARRVRSRPSVWLGKRALWVFAASLTLVIAVVSWMNSGDKGGRVVFTTEGGTGNALPAAMIRPRYQGLDAKNQPFTITADRASQVKDDHVLLENVNADLTLASGAWLAMSAAQGQYGTDTEMLVLKKNVQLFYEGYTFITDYAEVDVANGTAQGNLPIEGQGPMGTLQAKRFNVLDRGAKIRFNDEVKVTLYL